MVGFINIKLILTHYHFLSYILFLISYFLFLISYFLFPKKRAETGKPMLGGVTLVIKPQPIINIETFSENVKSIFSFLSKNLTVLIDKSVFPKNTSY